MSFLTKSKLRRTIIVLGGCVLLIALFYAEEDLRGWLAWNHFKHEWEAKGEHFDFKSFVPPPVPDEQNFALTPIVATSYECMLDKNGHELKPHRTNVVERLWMRVNHYPPGDTVSRIEPTNGDWRAEKMCDLKSWQMYYRTPFTNIFWFKVGLGGYWKEVTNSSAILTNDFAFPPIPQTPAADVLLALNKYDADIEELRAASRLTNSRFPLNYDAEPRQAVYLMHLAPLKYCCQTLQLRAIAELENGESQKALDDLTLALRLINSIRTEPFEISHLTRSEMSGMVVKIIWEGLAKHKWSAAQLSTLELELGRLDFLADCQRSLRGERSMNLDLADNLRNLRSYDEIRKIIDIFTRDQIINMSGTPEEEKEFESRLERKVTRLAWFYYLMPCGWYYQNQLIIAKIYQEQILQVANPAEHLFFSQKLGNAGKAIESLPHHEWNFLARRFSGAGAFSIIRKLVYAQETTDLARVACALERYRSANGAYPETLGVLSPQFILQVPHDIIGGQPLHYRRISNVKFLLYSVGWNEKDDGGVFVFREHSTYFVDDDKSDWVWRYPTQ
jgi:tetratricopeptide (TPR) repeat protein